MAAPTPPTACSYVNMRCRTILLPDDLHHDLTLTGAVVEVYVDDLLPCPQRETTADEGDGQGRSQESGADVRVAVAVTPAFVVSIVAAGRYHLVENLLQIIGE